MRESFSSPPKFKILAYIDKKQYYNKQITTINIKFCYSFYVYIFVRVL